MTLKVEGVVNRTVHAEEALGGSSRLEPLQLALASSDCLMCCRLELASKVGRITSSANQIDHLATKLR